MLQGFRGRIVYGSYEDFMEEWEFDLDFRGWVGFGEVGIQEDVWMQVYGLGVEVYVESLGNYARVGWIKLDFFIV